MVKRKAELALIARRFKERHGLCLGQGPIAMHFSRNNVSMRCKETANQSASSHETSPASALRRSTKERDVVKVTPR